MRKKISLLWLIILVLAQLVTAQQTLLSEDNTKSLIKQLIDNSRDTWISQGSLKVVYAKYQAPIILDETEIQYEIQERIKYNGQSRLSSELYQQYLDAIPFNIRYELQNEYTTTSTIYINVDGVKFKEERFLESRFDSISPSLKALQNPYITRLNADTNKNNVSFYDGTKFSQYCQAENLAIEKDSMGTPSLPRALKVGLVPWNQAFYTLQDVLKCSPIATSQWVDKRELITLEFQHESAFVTMTLDASKALAVLNWSITNSKGTTTNVVLSQYIQVNGQWMPTDIYVETQGPHNEAYRLLNYEQWQIELIQTTKPDVSVFSPPYKDQALIKYFSPLAKGELNYQYRQDFDTDELLTTYLLTNYSQEPQNCATVSINYIAKMLENPLTESSSTLIDFEGTSSLYDIKQFFNNQGLSATAIHTTLEGLSKYSNCYKIVHFPRINHYVIVEHIENDQVWIIDLTSRNFYISHSFETFNNYWTEGVALLVSKERISISDKRLDTSEIQTILGGTNEKACTLPGQYPFEYQCHISTLTGICERSTYCLYYPYLLCDKSENPQDHCEDNKDVIQRSIALCTPVTGIPDQCEYYGFEIETTLGCWGILAPPEE